MPWRDLLALARFLDAGSRRDGRLGGGGGNLSCLPSLDLLLAPSFSHSRTSSAASLGARTRRNYERPQLCWRHLAPSPSLLRPQPLRSAGGQTLLATDSPTTSRASTTASSLPHRTRLPTRVRNRSLTENPLDHPHVRRPVRNPIRVPSNLRSHRKVFHLERVRGDAEEGGAALFSCHRQVGRGFRSPASDGLLLYSRRDVLPSSRSQFPLMQIPSLRSPSFLFQASIQADPLTLVTQNCSLAPDPLLPLTSDPQASVKDESSSAHTTLHARFLPFPCESCASLAERASGGVVTSSCRLVDIARPRRAKRPRLLRLLSSELGVPDGERLRRVPRTVDSILASCWSLEQTRTPCFG
ncbi:hypothetical protein BJY59DRAFT_558936 [Rhodotorula toruloides]